MNNFADIDELLSKAKLACKSIENADQNKVDTIVKSLAWGIYKDDNAEVLAKLAVEDTKLGNVRDKILKNKRKTFGTLCDLLQAKTRGIASVSPETGLTTFFKPVGIVGSLTPSTNPAATPANQALMAIKGGNSIIISPSPTGLRTALKLKEFFDKQLDSVDAPRDLFQVVGPPINLEKAKYLSSKVDLLLVTGDQQNVRNGYRSGTPCIGVGKGNVPVIIDDDVDIEDAATKIVSSKVFDNATSCSSENSLIIHENVYDQMIECLEKNGGLLLDEKQANFVRENLYDGKNINREVIGKDLTVLDKIFRLNGDTEGKRFLIAACQDVGNSEPLSREKLSLILSVYKCASFEKSVEKVLSILEFEGKGHSVGIHTKNRERAVQLAAAAPVARVLMNQAHTFGNGGGFDNSLPFTLTMGCGTWAGNSISENLSIKHFLNRTQLVETIPKKTPPASDVFGHFYDEQNDNHS